MAARRIFPGLTLVAAAVLAGCGTLAPDYQRPAAPVAGAFPEAGGTTGPGAVAAADLPWQQFFRDERLKRLVGIALANNRDLRVAVLNIEQARAQYGVQRADLFPTLGVGVSGNRVSTDSGINSTYQAGLAVSSYELDLFGRVRSLNNAALASYLATEEARKAVHIGLIASVANGYLALQADDELLRVTRETLATRAESLKLTQLRFDVGASSQLDLRQAQSLYEAARATHAQLLRQRAQDENALVLLLGQPLPGDLPAALPLSEQAALPELPAGLPSQVLTRRPDVLQAEQQLIAANARIGAARAAFFPQITLTATAGSASSELSGLFKGGSTGWTFAPQLLMPIFDAGRNRANLDSANAGRDIAVAQYEKAVQAAFREVADALAGRATLGEQLAALQAQVKAEQGRVELAELRYRNGAASYLDLLDAQRSLFAAQQSEVQVRALQAQNLVTLYRVLGGGWREADATTAAAAAPAASAPR
ncbi:MULTISPECIES: efflux transporter outer membrane subunit [unclassified Rubrivivax]|uniref:efflux transporter outer membrane subunit n=1 Tax=unclassified Rubrivivax TaxID=2649762 RepID=UPI001E629567|nr:MULTISPECIES: efflux transporter outer membrane subunit [unclassified Rubrivivax]MCC9597942.1 efflux transporter outer membrane subunit [Rubrivivax sp. JA1055]MCC9645801.1 efflux transporter outer membrane subunit [Rubrivivax sp. JA1029]